MPRYNYRTNFNHQARSAHRTKHVAAVLITIVLIGFTVVGIDWLKQSHISPKTSGKEKSSVQAATISIFRTQYFQFQTSPSWSEISSDTKPGNYLYRSFKGPLVDQELKVTVNIKDPTVPAMTRTTRVFPVQIEANGQLTAMGDASDHCKKTVPKGGSRVPHVVTIMQVKFMCNPDSDEFNIVVGVVGGTNSMTIKRPNGTSAVYNITYRNLSATPSARDLRSVVETFETR